MGTRHLFSENWGLIIKGQDRVCCITMLNSIRRRFPGLFLVS